MKISDIKDYTVILRKNIVLIIAAALIFAAAFGGYKIHSMNKTVGSAGTDSADYSAQMEKYQAKKTNIDNYLKLIDKNLTYGFYQLSNDPILALDPNHCKYEVISVIYDDTDAYRDEFFQSYIRSIDSAQLFKAEADKYDSFKSDILYANSGDTTGCTLIYCFPVEEHTAKEIADRFVNVLNTKDSAVMKSLKITAVDRRSVDGECPALRTRQENITNYPIALETEIRRVNEQGRLIAAPTNTSVAESEKGTIGSAIKYAIAGGIIGLLLGIAFVIYKAACGGIVLLSRQIEERFELDCIGKIPANGLTKDAADTLDASINAIVDGRNSIMILDRAYPDAFTEMISRLNGSSAGKTVYEYGKDIIEDTDALNAANKTDGIIIGIDKGITTFEEVYKTLVRANSLNKKVIGYLLAE